MCSETHNIQFSNIACDTSHQTLLFIYIWLPPVLLHSFHIQTAHLKVKGVSKLSGGVNMVNGESVPIISVAFPVGVSSQVQPLRELA